MRFFMVAFRGVSANVRLDSTLGMRAMRFHLVSKVEMICLTLLALAQTT